MDRSYYCFCLEQAITATKQARQLIEDKAFGDKDERSRKATLLDNHLRDLYRLLEQA